MIAEAALVILLGVAAGVAAGLFGVGGGIIFVPTLTLVLGLGQLEAEATSLLAIIPVAVLGSWRQTRSGEVRWRDATVIGLVSVGDGRRGCPARRRRPRACAADGLRDPDADHGGAARRHRPPLGGFPRNRYSVSLIIAIR